MAAAILAVGLLSSGCNDVTTASTAAYEPAKLSDVGSLGLKQVTFTPEAARRVSLQTETAVQSGRHVVVSYAALIYDGKGVPWVYTASVPLRFLRAKVTVDQVKSGRVYLSGGLRAGTKVVTVGATEVYGAELEIAGGH